MYFIFYPVIVLLIAFIVSLIKIEILYSYLTIDTSTNKPTNNARNEFI